MRNNHSVIVNAYFFISEAIILFFLAIPFFHLLFKEIPYWRYLLIVVVMAALFTYFYKIKSYAPYLIATAGIIALCYFIGMPIFFAVVLPAVLVFRFILLREGKVETSEKTYLMIGITGSVILGLWIQQIEIVYYIILLFINTIIGHLISHLVVTAKEDRKQFQHRTWLYLGGTFLLIGAIIYFFFDIFRGLITKIWLFIQFILISIVHLIAKLILPLFDIEFDRKNPEMKLDAKLEGDFQDLIGNQSFEQLPNYLIYIAWALGIIIALLIVFYIYRLMRRRFTQGEEEREVVEEEITYEQLTDQESPEKKKKQIFKKLFEKPMHPARKAVLQFENQAVKNGYGRMKSETIEEWFLRIGISVNTLVYQKVRYGELDISDAEVELLKKELTEIETRLKR